MTPAGFIAKWSKSTLSERSACQQHFLDLCDLLGQAKPAAADPDGAWYTFERGVKTTDDDRGWADVWMKDRFAWEYKGKHKDLAAAYKQLLKYREALDNPPLLVVCDMDRFQVHTNFTGTRKVVHEFDLASLAEPANLDILRKPGAMPAALGGHVDVTIRHLWAMPVGLHSLTTSRSLTAGAVDACRTGNPAIASTNRATPMP